MNNQNKRDPEERVERMNSIFDRLVLPMVIFTLAMFIAFGVVPKLVNCDSPDAPQEGETTTQQDFYSLRKILLADVKGNRALFEAAGYSVVEDSTTGRLMPYRALDSGTEIIDNLCDSSGTIYSVVYRTDAETGYETNVMIYASTIFCVVVTDGQSSVSAIFRNEEFVPDGTSSADAGQSDVLAVVTSESISALLDEYKQSMMSVVE